MNQITFEDAIRQGIDLILGRIRENLYLSAEI